jgi:hypothetical protein
MLPGKGAIKSLTNPFSWARLKGAKEDLNEEGVE